MQWFISVVYNITLRSWHVNLPRLRACCTGPADDALDNEELLELAQAGRSQPDQDAHPLWPQQQERTKDLVSPDIRQAEEQMCTGQAMASHEQALPGSKPDPPASAAGNAYLELDDDELIELACLDPQHDGIAALQQPLQLLTTSDSDTRTQSTHTHSEATGGNSQGFLGVCNEPLPQSRTSTCRVCAMPLPCRSEFCWPVQFQPCF